MKKEIFIIISLIVFGLYVINPFSKNISQEIIFYYWISSLAISIFLLFYRMWKNFDELENEMKKEVERLKEDFN